MHSYLNCSLLNLLVNWVYKYLSLFYCIAQVFAFGSVPLKTYLPDGDIDLTVLGNTSYESNLVNDVSCILESEEQNSDAEFVVKDLERINAEVRLIKCTIANIIVDISFNQTGGICALCFLELVDRKIGKDHLFKRSIILIKAWCYYESRLLGAHHGLISTYALEVLILYIFNLFHKSLHSPLEVLYRFLEYFSKFDWDSYCISLNGPVALASLPNLIVETTVKHTDDLLFDKEFLKSSVDKATVPPRNSDECYTRFRPKYLNIIDPLKEYNNLGRSVNKASFHRIRTAFLYGARKLGHILMLPPEVIPDEIYRFFKNTLGRNGRGVRPDTGSNGAFHASFGTGEALLEDVSCMKISYDEEDENKTSYHLSKSLGDKNFYVGTNGPTHLNSSFPRVRNTALSTDLSTRSSNFVHHAPKQYSSFYQGNGHVGSGKCYLNHELEQVSHFTAKAFHMDDQPSIQSQVPVNTLELATEQKTWSDVPVEKQHLPPSPLSLPDLSGDLDSQFRCLRQVQYHLEFLFDGFLQSVQEASSADMFDKDPFHIPAHSILFNRDSATPRLLLPSSAKSNGRNSSPVSCSQSTEYVSQHSRIENPWDRTCQQNVSLPSGTGVPPNGRSPSSSYADSEVSSISWCYSSEDSAEMHGSRRDTYFSRKNCDTQRLASSRENGKILSNQPVRFGSNQSSAPGPRFVSHKEQVALDSRTKEALKIERYIHSDRKIVEKLNCHTQKNFVRDNDEASQVPKYHQDVCSNSNFLQKRYDTDMESARAPSAMNQIPKHQSFNIQNTTEECARASLSKNLPRKSSFGTRKEHEIFDRPTKQRPICEPLKLENRRSGWDCSKKTSAGKQNYNNHREHLSFVGGVHMPCSNAANTPNGLEREVNSNNLVENGSRLRPLLPDVSLSCDSINSQERPPVSNTSQPYFPLANGRPLETIEFGSLGPFALTSLKSNRANLKIASKVFTDASPLLLQRSRAATPENRSPGFCKVGDEDEFPPLTAGIR
ncbi:hypothetical protein BAE44_0019711 [Dichanthelium oligosanthes]|uniref:Uncharacterized protein n=1 Tax=Dichanthelium oligosanthes TaxID=888268 RepID=A0A1E5V294_9POAL|nr:hypothetical protein BAE44_0019711 [Dichanthelium oligosanthes]